nr:hypothetical protein Iba_chr11cCG13420 [Ipomoea batatas]
MAFIQEASEEPTSSKNWFTGAELEAAKLGSSYWFPVRRTGNCRTGNHSANWKPPNWFPVRGFQFGELEIAELETSSPTNWFQFVRRRTSLFAGERTDFELVSDADGFRCRN